MSRARLDYSTPAGASVCKYGEPAALAAYLRKCAPVGATLYVETGGGEWREIGRVDACDGSCGRRRCARHWYFETGADVEIEKPSDEAAVTEQIHRVLVPAVESGTVRLGGIVATGPTWIEVEHNGRLYLVSITDNGAA